VKSAILWDVLKFQSNVLPPSSWQLCKTSRQLLVVCVPYSLTLKMEVIHFLVMLMKFYKATRCHTSGDNTLHTVTS
jgi:hypothetical protein